MLTSLDNEGIHTKVPDNGRIYKSRVHCNTLQHTAMHCNTLQYTATHRNIENACMYIHMHTIRDGIQEQGTLLHTLLHTATHGNTLQRTAT